jgi:hypothetical protein
MTANNLKNWFQQPGADLDNVYHGEGTNNFSGTITNSAGFQPDLIWTKSRSDAEAHRLHDSVRGGNGTVLYELNSNNTEVDGTDTLVSGFASNGFTIAAGANSPNITGRTYVGWQWDAGTTTVTNTSGSISAQVRANPTAGFSVVTWTGTGSVGTVGHGLGVAPSFFIVKYRTGTAPNIAGWACYHKSLTSAAYRIDLNSTGTQTSDTNAWNSTAPTSSVLTIGTNLSVGSTTMVAYCFAQVAGYSAFGTWQNTNTNDGRFVYLGFRPSFVLLKSYDGAEQWFIQDSSRQTYNYGPGTSNYLVPSSAVTEAANGAQNSAIDFLSNGFKIRSTNTGAGEISFGTRNYIYAAFAENPFKYSLAR